MYIRNLEAILDFYNLIKYWNEGIQFITVEGTEMLTLTEQKKYLELKLKEILKNFTAYLLQLFKYFLIKMLFTVG